MEKIMLNPSIGVLIQNNESRYKLVLDVAKKAREIAKDAQDNGQIIIEKPVTLAMDQMAAEVTNASVETEEAE
jgi:DNA-directed RNA polymerase subunit omega